MKANFNDLPPINLYTNIPYRTGENAPAQMVYVADITDTLLGENWITARFNPASYLRRRNPETNELVHRMDLPAIKAVPAFTDGMIGSREHYDITPKPQRRKYTPTIGQHWSAFIYLSRIALQAPAHATLETDQYKYLKPGFPGTPIPKFAHQLLTEIIRRITTVIRAGVFNIPCQIEVATDSPQTEVPHYIHKDPGASVHDRLKKPLR